MSSIPCKFLSAYTEWHPARSDRGIDDWAGGVAIELWPSSFGHRALAMVQNATAVILLANFTIILLSHFFLFYPCCARNFRFLKRLSKKL